MSKYIDLLMGLFCGFVLTILGVITYNNRYSGLINFELFSIVGAMISVLFIILILIKVFKSIRN
jgi:flagellar biogenesis protein FliO